MAGTRRVRRRRMDPRPLGWRPLKLREWGEALAAGRWALEKWNNWKPALREPCARSQRLGQHPRSPRRSLGSTSFPTWGFSTGSLSASVFQAAAFICSRWATIVSYLPSLVFLSFISIQTIPELLAKLYIVSHSFLLQTQYPPWARLACFHLPCCVYPFYKLLFHH